MRRYLLPVLPAMLALAALAPAALAHQSTEKTTVEGTLRVWHGDTFAHPVSVGRGRRYDDRRSGPARAGTGLDGLPCREAGARKWRTTRQGSRGLGRRAGCRADHAVAAATGSKSVAVLLFNFAGDTRSPGRPTAVRNVVFDGSSSVNAYYQDASYGQMSISGDVYGWFTIDAPNTGCDYTTWASQARSKATAAGVPLANYAYTVYAFPNVSGCGWAGLAYLPGTGSWINGSMNLRVVGHELGHNFGVHHASTLACTSAGSPRRPLAVVLRERVRGSVHDHGVVPDTSSQQLAPSAAGVDADADSLVVRDLLARAGGDRDSLSASAPGSTRRWDVSEPRVPAANGELRQLLRERSGGHGRVDPHRARHVVARAVEADRREPHDHDIRRRPLRPGAVPDRSRFGRVGDRRFGVTRRSIGVGAVRTGRAGADAARRVRSDVRRARARFASRGVHPRTTSG